MNETNIESIQLVQLDLKGTSRLVVLLGSKDGIRGISKKLMQYDDLVRVGKGLFIAGSNVGIYTDILQSLPSLTFIRTREILGIKARLDDPHAYRAYSIVSYSFNSPTPGQKKRVERLLRRSIGVRLRPGVLLFPVLRARERRKILDYEKGHSLLDSKEFSNQLKSMGAQTMRWSRLRLADHLDSVQIKEAIERTLNRDLLSIESKLQELRELSKNPLIPTDALRKQSAAVLRRYRTLKFKWKLAKTLWFFDAEKSLKRIYNLGLNTKYMIDGRD
ncbi:MAG: hypothetical protein OEV85_00565 [Candidatus Thorarchaeota archaeon]|nr:hypothetical protein [Candidatus Thorarchaeota archaeon]